MVDKYFKGEFLCIIILILIIISCISTVQAEYPPGFCDVDMDVVLALDKSISMDEYGTSGMTKLEEAVIASILFINITSGSNDQSSLVSFCGTATLNKELSNNYTKTITKLADIIEYGTCSATNGGDAINISNNELISSRSNNTHKKIGILLTDGQFNRGGNCGSCSDAVPDTCCKNYSKAQAVFAKNRNITIFTIGFGVDSSYLDNITLMNISNTTGGKYFFITNGSQLFPMFLDIATEMCGCGLGCPTGSVCLNNLCVSNISNTETYWADNSNPDNNITQLNAVVNSTTALLMIKNARLPGGGILNNTNLTFKIKEDDDIINLSSVTDAGGDANVSWLITSADLAKTPNDYTEFYFEVYQGTTLINKSGYLELIFQQEVIDLCNNLTANNSEGIICPSQTPISFFGFYNVIAVIVIASVVHLFIILGRKKKIIKDK